MDEPDLTVAVTACTEPIVLMVGRSHELADRTSVSLDELAAYDVLPSGLRLPEYWEKAISPAARRTVVADRPAPTREEVLWAIAHDDQAVAFACGQGLKYYDRGVAAYIPIDEGPTLRWGMVHRTDQLGRWARELVSVAKEFGPIELSLELDSPRPQPRETAG